MRKSGYVYVLLNPAFPRMVKIGLTTRTVDVRVRELRSTGVPIPFVVLWQEHVADVEAVEKSLHDRFAGFRVEDDREFFYVPPQDAIGALIEEGVRRAAPPPPPIHSQDVLDHLKTVLGAMLRPDICEATFVQDPETCFLIAVRRAKDGGYRDEIVEKTDLSVVMGMSASRSFQTNIEDFLSFDRVTFAAVTTVMNPDDARRVYDESIDRQPG
jgi:hypothetical protein